MASFPVEVRPGLYRRSKSPWSGAGVVRMIVSVVSIHYSAYPFHPPARDVPGRHLLHEPHHKLFLYLRDRASKVFHSKSSFWLSTRLDAHSFTANAECFSGQYTWSPNGLNCCSLNGLLPSLYPPPGPASSSSSAAAAAGRFAVAAACSFATAAAGRCKHRGPAHARLPKMRMTGISAAWGQR